eukprot:1144019-Pelagomonas_calceolata.AAC.4
MHIQQLRHCSRVGTVKKLMHAKTNMRKEQHSLTASNAENTWHGDYVTAQWGHIWKGLGAGAPFKKEVVVKQVERGKLVIGWQKRHFFDQLWGSEAWIVFLDKLQVWPFAYMHVLLT